MKFKFSPENNPSFQLICEAYHIMKDVLDMSHDEMADTFEEWNKGELDSFLVTILWITWVSLVSDFEE